MPKAPHNPDEMQDWTNEEAPEKYDAVTMGDNEDQDDEETLAMQSDSEETVAARAPALRTRGSRASRGHGDTRENAGAKLDNIEGDAAAVNTPQPPRPTRGSGRPSTTRRMRSSRARTAKKTRAAAKSRPRTRSKSAAKSRSTRTNRSARTRRASAGARSTRASRKNTKRRGKGRK